MAVRIIQVELRVGRTAYTKAIGSAALGGTIVSFDYYHHTASGITGIVAKGSGGNILEAYIDTPMLISFEDVP